MVLEGNVNHCQIVRKFTYSLSPLPCSRSIGLNDIVKVLYMLRQVVVLRQFAIKNRESSRFRWLLERDHFDWIDWKARNRGKGVASRYISFLNFPFHNIDLLV
jgi:hypothetical protein